MSGLKAGQYEIPDGLLYTKEHEWAQINGEEVVVGITEYAAKTLNDIVYVSLISEGQTVKQTSSFGTVESIKAVSELYSPFSGLVVKVNPELSTHPELVNQSPYENGWLLRLKPSNLNDEKKNLLSSRQYAELVGPTIK